MNWMFLPFRRFAEFTGRSRPMELWMFALLQLLIYIGITVLFTVIVGGVAGIASAQGGVGAGAGLGGIIAAMGLFALLYGLVYLVFFIPNLAVSTRRLHDSGKSGFWVLLYFVPAVLGWVLRIAGMGSLSSTVLGLGMMLSGLALLGLIAMIVLWCLPGTVGPNRYGPDPLAAERARMGDVEGFGAPGVGLDKSY